MVMTENTGQRTVRVTNPDGLHLRTCEAIAKVASEFQAKATVSRGEKRAKAESVLDLMGLGAAEGTELNLEASGPDAVGLLDALAKVI
jgi:phosphotransferase system HPr (HPr) family protein